MEKLLGFDAREMWTEFKERWSEQRIARHLLRTGIKKPLSTDRLVWDSVFNSPFEDDTIWIDFCRGPSGLWHDLDHMKDNLHNAWGENWKPCWLIAITRDSVDKTETAPDARFTPENWIHLGYDVSDQGLLSGLSNCGYGPGKEVLVEKWAPFLNQYHLFQDFDPAQQFKDLTDEQVPEHAPFSVYGVYLVEQHI